MLKLYSSLISIIHNKTFIRKRGVFISKINVWLIKKVNEKYSIFNKSTTWINLSESKPFQCPGKSNSFNASCGFFSRKSFFLVSKNFWGIAFGKNKRYGGKRNSDKGTTRKNVKGISLTRSCFMSPFLGMENFVEDFIKEGKRKRNGWVWKKRSFRKIFETEHSCFF